MNKGLIVGYNTIPNEEDILKLLEAKGFQRDYAIRCLDANKHNHATTCYYLLLKKLEKEGKINSSNYYQSAQTLYPRSLHESRESSIVNDFRNANSSLAQNSKRLSVGAHVQGHRLISDSLTSNP